MDILEAYFNLSSSLSVDIIGHPEMPEGDFSPEYWQKWEGIFKNLRSSGICLEISLPSLINPNLSGKRAQLLEFFIKAKESGVKFTLGVDFHRLESLMVDYLPSGEEQPDAKKAREALKALSEKVK